MVVKLKSLDEEETDHVLGPKLLFSFDEIHEMGGPTRQTLTRAANEKLFEVVRNGASVRVTRATAKQILLKGLGPISFLYGKGRAKKPEEVA